MSTAAWQNLLLPFLEAQRLNSRCWWGHTPYNKYRGEAFLPLLAPSGSNLSSLHVAFSSSCLLCMYLVRILTIGFKLEWLHFKIFNLVILARTLFPNKITSTGPRD